MTRTRAGKKLDALDAKIAALTRQRRELELQALGAEADDASRRERYFAIADATLRRRLIGIERRLHGLGREQRAATVTYWQVVVAETRRKLDDLKSDSPSSGWKRAIWWDVATVFWILAGLGWLTYQVPGAIVGGIAAAIWARFIVRGREKSRVAFLRQGDDALRSGESHLAQAEREAAVSSEPPFSAREEETGVATSAGA